MNIFHNIIGIRNNTSRSSDRINVSGCELFKMMLTNILLHSWYNENEENHMEM